MRMIIPCQVFKKTPNNSSYLIWGILEYRAFWVKKKKLKGLTGTAQRWPHFHPLFRVEGRILNHLKFSEDLCDSLVE